MSSKTPRDPIAYLNAATKKLKRLRPAENRSPETIRQAEAVLTQFQEDPQKSEALQVLSDISADLVAVAFILAGALSEKNWVEETRKRRGKLSDTARQAWKRAKQTDDLQKMIEAIARPEAFEAQRLTGAVTSHLSRTRPRYNEKGRVVAGSLNEWPTIRAHSRLYQLFKNDFGRPHDEVIAIVLKVFGLLRIKSPDSTEVEVLKRQRNRLRKKYPFLFLDPTPPRRLTKR